MQYIVIGRTYKALLGDDKIHTFEVIEDETDIDETVLIRWDDGCEDWNYPEDLFRMMQAAEEKEMEERLK